MKDIIENFTISFTENYKLANEDKSVNVKVNLNNDEALAFISNLTRIEGNKKNKLKTAWELLVNKIIALLEKQMIYDWDPNGDKIKEIEKKIYENFYGNKK